MKSKNLDILDFRNMTEETHGMMSPENYFYLYKLAGIDAVNSVLDIGVGRGMTSIAYALGLMSKNCDGKVLVIDQFFQVRSGPHAYSKSSHPENCVELNVAEFRSNLSRYGVLPVVDYLVGATSDVYTDLPQGLTFDILSIDVVGSIDRDLGLFYDRVTPGGYVVIDDYADIVDKRGRERIERMRGGNETSI